MGDPELIEIIRAEIAARGPISFARFMELALYEPQHGYYSSGRAVIGRRGDFFTNVSVGPVFGQLLAIQFAEVWEKLGRPSHFTIIEHGADDGAFAADALTALSQSFAECFKTIRYIIAEPFPVWRDRQQERLASFGHKIRWVASIDQVEPFVGVHFSNELFDALPVHLLFSELVKNGTVTWNERFVSTSDNDFELVTGPVSDSHLEIALRRLHPEARAQSVRLQRPDAALHPGHLEPSDHRAVSLSNDRARTDHRGGDRRADPAQYANAVAVEL